MVAAKKRHLPPQDSNILFRLRYNPRDPTAGISSPIKKTGTVRMILVCIESVAELGKLWGFRNRLCNFEDTNTPCGTTKQKYSKIVHATQIVAQMYSIPHVATICKKLRLEIAPQRKLIILSTN